MATSPQLVILGQMVHYIDSTGERFAGLVTRIRGKGCVDLIVFHPETAVLHRYEVAYDGTELKRNSWHTTLCSGCKRMAVGYEKKDA